MTTRLMLAVFRHSFPFALLMSSLLFAGACAQLPSDRPASHEPTLPQSERVPCTDRTTYREVGMASWYGKDRDGQRAASGDRIDMNGLAASHRSLPLGSSVRIVNLDNYRSVRVKVNDRGPLVRSRILDISYGAAKELGFVEAGVAPVRMELVEQPSETAPEVYTVHAASFVEEESALALKHRLSRKFETVYIHSTQTTTTRFFHVRVGEYPSEEKAERVAAKLVLEGVEPLVLRKDN